MNALLLCPSERPAVARLAEQAPLAVAPLLGRSLIEHWVDHLVARNVTHVTVLAHDRPSFVRNILGDGRRWGIRIEVVPVAREYSADEARTRFRADASQDSWFDPDLVVMDHLPGQPDHPLFEGYAGWFAAARAWMPRAASPGRIGLREIRPGIWAGLRLRCSASAELVAPCWIGDHVRIGPHARVGPGAVVDNQVVIGEGARVVESIVEPDTFVGDLVSIENSLARGRLLINWRTDSSVEVPDEFLLAPLAAAISTAPRPGLLGRVLAALAMLATSPFAAIVIGWSILRGDAPAQVRLGLRCQRGSRRFVMSSFAYYELTGARNWLRRWPQFWSIIRGDLTWIGNRPLRPAQAFALVNEFERLWLAAPVGLISLADAHGCPDGWSDEACAHACFYAANANRKLDWFIVSRGLLRAAMAWPIWGHRRRDATVPLQQLVPKQEI